MRKKITVCLTLLLLLVAALGVTACSKSNGLEKEYRVEYGETFMLPKPDGEYTVTVTDGNGREVRTQFGSFRPSVGEYTAVYDIGGKQQTVTVVCADTVAPTVTFFDATSDAYEGDTLTFPQYRVEDLSAVQSEQIAVTKSDGSTVTLDANNQWIAENDVYTVSVTAVDVYGNARTDAITVSVRAPFSDPTMAAGMLYDFDEDEYRNLVYREQDKESFDYSIVRSGYPEIADEAENNGVLELSTAYNYGDVCARIAPNRPFAVRTVGSIKVKVAVDRDVDYIKFYTPGGKFVAAGYMLSGNVWNEIEIKSIDYGYADDWAGLLLTARADGGLTVYVDSITCTDAYRPELPDGTLAAFDDERYVSRIYQNVYNSSGAQCYAGGSTFAIVEEGGQKCMRVTTTMYNGGFTYMLDDVLDLANVESVTVRMKVHVSPNVIWLGALEGTGIGGNNSYAPLAGWLDGWNKLKVGEMYDCVIPVTTLRGWCADGKLSGIWLGVQKYGGQVGNVIDLQSITVQYAA